MAPKSNTVGRAYGAALDDVQSSRNDRIPLHLRNAPTNLMRSLGYGEGYRYAHSDYADALGDRAYFEPTKQGDEARLRAWIDRRRRSATGAESELFGEDERGR